jgi:hypothetical protein
MYRSGQQLRTTSDFDNAIFFSLNIEVYQENEPIDRGGFIQKHNEETVIINGAYFFKELCSFRVR